MEIILPTKINLLKIEEIIDDFAIYKYLFFTATNRTSYLIHDINDVY